MIREIISKLEITQSIHLVGWSMGGILAQFLAAKYPTLFRSLVLVNTTSKLPNRYNIQDVYKMSQLLEKDMNHNISKKNYDIISDDIKGTTNIDVIAFYTNEVFTFDSTKVISLITIPTLIISGKSDELTLPEYGRIIHSHIKNSDYVVLKNAGHYIPLFHPEYFNKKVSRFLQKIIRT